MGLFAWAAYGRDDRVEELPETSDHPVTDTAARPDFAPMRQFGASSSAS
ncbi:hypothetical protein GCM10018793_32810 [Streptomyces sulfonofaciens]|uniref:Uncharacterized protein n=1 Tax=Streptomyces sulfonofaciens TaxID=68272 RepID=A0A919G863_9ACTN|nr:hypothetical protein GCM10018793_32810 [Streptomyces sulfonofaciens]